MEKEIRVKVIVSGVGLKVETIETNENIRTMIKKPWHYKDLMRWFFQDYAKQVFNLYVEKKGNAKIEDLDFLFREFFEGQYYDRIFVKDEIDFDIEDIYFDIEECVIEQGFIDKYGDFVNKIWTIIVLGNETDFNSFPICHS